MRLVVKREEHKTPKLAAVETYQALKQICIQGKEAKPSIYRQSYDGQDERLSLVIKHLNFSYLGKCGYCERQVELEVDHYRPKSRYYWLCYEWSNLVPACHSCNSYKGFKFEIEGKRVTQPSWVGNEFDLDKFKAENQPLIDEQPILLHPELDDPKDYFLFEVGKDTDIKIKGIEGNNRGKKTIDICRLNREAVTLSRHREVCSSLVEQLEFVYDEYGDSSKPTWRFEIVSDKLQKVLSRNKNSGEDDKLPHTLLRQYMYQNSQHFCQIMLPYLPKNMSLMVKFVAKQCLD